MGNITSTDRLLFTLLFSAIINLSLLFGVGFDVEAPLTNQPVTNIDITLVKQKTNFEPEQADYLAQVNNEGGGETEEKDPEPSKQHAQPDNIKNQLATAAPEVMPTTEPIEEQVIPAEPTPTPELVPVPVTPPTPPQAKVKTATSNNVITQQKAERKVTKVEDIAEKHVIEETVTPPKPKISAAQLMSNARSEIVRLEQEFDARAASLSKRPKKRPISASTKEYAAAAYMKSWEHKVERIGNFNYPQEARRLGLNGSLMLSVDINPDGSVPPDGIVISRSSGHKVLDDAAVRIVRLGAPYAAIPKNVLGDYDMLTVIRTWKFETNRGLSTR